MTFNPAVPQNSNSPSLFPTQNQTNMARLKALIEADHQFNNTADTNDGYHKLIHMIPQAPVDPLPDTGRLYVKTIGGLIQLWYMDDAGNEYQVTPLAQAPTRITGSEALPAFSSSLPVYVVPDNTQGTIFVTYTAGTGTNLQNLYSYYLFYKAGSTNVRLILLSGGSVGPPASATVLAGTNDLSVLNNLSNPATVGYWINLVSF